MIVPSSFVAKVRSDSSWSLNCFDCVYIYVPEPKSTINIETTFLFACYLSGFGEIFRRVKIILTLSLSVPTVLRTLIEERKLKTHFHDHRPVKQGLTL